MLAPGATRSIHLPDGDIVTHKYVEVHAHVNKPLHGDCFYFKYIS